MKSILENNNQFDDLILKVCNIAIEAGLIINTYYNSKTSVSFKNDKSPLTEADIASNNYIIQELSKIKPNIPIISEESLVNWSTRKNWLRYWLVDPLDGTKEFIKHNDEFTVNIALIEKNEPIMGVIYAPAFFDLYYAGKNNGAYKLSSNKKIESLSKSKLIKANIKKNSEHLTVFGSRSHSNENFDQWISKNLNNYDLVKRGSSLKFCELAEGKADLYPRFGPTSEWDIAAGHIILTEAGGEIKSVDQKKILYNLKESVINPNFIASCKYLKNV